MAEEKEFKHPLTKIEEFSKLMSNVPYAEREEMCDYFEILRVNLIKAPESYKNLENLVEWLLTDIKIKINDTICNEKRPPEDELIEYQNELIQAKKSIYSVIEKYTDVLEKYMFTPEVIEKYSNPKK